MKKFYLLKLFPSVNLTGFQGSENQVIGEVVTENKTDAVEYFQQLRPDLELDNDGYAKHDNISYCVVEQTF